MSRLLDMVFSEHCALCGEPVEYGRTSPFCRACQVKWESEKFQLRSFDGELPAFDFPSVDGGHPAMRVICTVAYDPTNHDTAASHRFHRGRADIAARIGAAGYARQA